MRNFIARLLARFIVRRRYVTAAEIHKAIAAHNEWPHWLDLRRNCRRC